MKLWGKILRLIDFCSLWSGRLVSWLLIALIIVVMYEVIARYVFNAPTVWYFDMGYMLGGTAYIMGGAYVLYLKRHARVDIIYKNLSYRTRLIIDIIFTLVFFFPLFGGLLDFSIRQLYHSWVVGELSSRGVAWQPIMYPFRATVPVGIILLLLQGIANFSRDLIELFKGKNE